jgi:hypothetical protein
MTAKISENKFVVRAIKKLRVPPYKGIHSVYSGFNQAFREYFHKEPVEVINKLVADGKIISRPVKGGVLIYLPEDYPSYTAPKTVLKKILEKGLKRSGLSEPEDEPDGQHPSRSV